MAPWRWIVPLGLAAALLIGGVVWTDRPMRKAFGLAWAAGHRYMRPTPPGGPTGPLPVLAVDVVLDERQRGSPYPVPILASLHVPVATARADGQATSCVDWLSRNPPPPGAGRSPVVLFAPGNGGGRGDAASSLANLASHGFVVLAIDDTARDEGRFARPGIQARTLDLDISTADAYAATLRDGATKAREQAEKALVALDRLSDCVAWVPTWTDRVDTTEVGFLGFSFGGATAAEAGVMDPRIKAVFNLDGWIFGRALAGELDRPYALVLSDDAPPSPKQLRSTEVGDRNYVDLTERLIVDASQPSERYGGCVTRIIGSRHEGFIDAYFERRFARSWLRIGPERMKAIRDDLEVGFFDQLKTGRPDASCQTMLDRWPELERVSPRPTPGMRQPPK